ncbi:MAG: O-antigen ligase family protein, partial [Syntrophothermus sp.]
YSFSFYFKAITSDESKKLVLVFSGFSVITALTGIIRFNLSMVHRASSIVSGYATYSTYMLAAIPLLFLLYTQLTEKQKKYVWPAAAGLVFSGLILAMSRADLAAGVIVLLASVFYIRPKFVSILIFVLITAAVSIISFHNNSREVTNRIDNISTTSDRNVLWGNAFRKAGDHPFLGFGPKTFPVIFDERDKLGDKEVGGWHNEYISFYIESGISALLPFLALAVYTLIFAAGKIFKRRNEEYSRAVFLLFLCIAGMYMSAFFSGVFSDPLLSVLFSFLMGWYFSNRPKSVPALKTA